MRAYWIERQVDESGLSEYELRLENTEGVDIDSMDCGMILGGFRVASIDDIIFDLCVGGDVIDGEIQVIEGVCRYDEDEGGYILI